MTTPLTDPITPADVKAFYEDILSGRGDWWTLIEIDLASGKEEQMTGRTLRLRFEASAADDLVVSGLLGKAGRLH